MAESRQRGFGQAEGNLSIPGFTTMVHDMLDMAWGQDWGRFLPAFPSGTDPSTNTLPVITYSYDKQPGTRGAGSNGPLDLQPRYIDRVKVDDEETGETHEYSIYAQRFDVAYTLEVWHTSADELEDLTRELERFFITYYNHFRQKGLKHMHLQSLGTQTQSEPWRNDVIGRSLTYFMQFEDQHLIPVYPLENIRTYVDGIEDPFAST